MTARQRRATQKYVDSLRPRLGLTDWAIDVYDEFLDEDDDALAVCHKHHARKAAVVAFRSDFFQCAPSYQRHVIVHELLHAVHAAPETFVFKTLGDHLPAKQHALLSDAWRLLHEYSVDGLACAIAPLFPEPNLP